MTVKKRPILFSSPMVRAILAGRKTQTRRVMKPQPKNEPSECPWTKTGWANTDDEGRCLCGNKLNPPCGVGDLLWVRETFRTWAQGVEYRADFEEELWGWTPSIHMPRCASRITLEVTGVRAERLFDISDNDARSEGFESAMEFARFWDSIAKPGAKWAENPWVWVIEFRRMENAQGE